MSFPILTVEDIAAAARVVTGDAWVEPGGVTSHVITKNHESAAPLPRRKEHAVEKKI